MNQEIENQYQSNIDMNDINQNILSFKEIPTLKKKKKLGILTSSYNPGIKNQEENLEGSRKSLDNLINFIPQKELKRFNTQKNIIRINKKNRVIKHIPNTHNYFILAKKNNLYGNSLNNNEPNNLTTNKNIELNNDIFAKKITTRFNRNNEQTNNYKIINNKITNYNLFIHTLNENNKSNNNIINNINNNISKLNNNLNFHKKVSNDLFFKPDLNSTMPNPYERKNEINKDNIINYSNRKNVINENQKDMNKIINIKDKFLTNIKLGNKKIFKSKNKNIFIQRQFSEIKPKMRRKSKSNKNDLSWDFGNNVIDINQQNMNFYKKSKSGIVPNNFYSEKKVRKNKTKKENINNNDSSDKDIDEIIDIFFENEDENKLNKTMIEKSKTNLNDSINLSDLADDLINLNPEQESKQETVPSTSNLDTDGFLEHSNSININLNKINFNIPFNANKMPNKPTIENNFYRSSPDTRNNVNNNSKDINYNLFVVNEYNNTNNNINNNINNNDNVNNKLNLNIPSLVTRTYKSPFIYGNNKNKINNKDINEIEDSEINLDFNQFKNISKENNNYQNDLDNNNYSKNINDNKILNTEPLQNVENEKFIFLNDQINYPNQNNLKKKSKSNKKEMKFRESILRDLLSSHKNTPSNNNVQISDKKFMDINDKLYKNNDIIYNNHNNNYLNNEDEFNNKNINQEINQVNDINNYNQYSEERNNNSINNSNQKKKNKKTKGHISFNLDNNIYIKFKNEDLITDSLVTDINGQIYQHKEKDMLIYQTELKLANPKSIIKTFSKNEIGINNEYIYVENLQERQILPDLYDDFEEDDLKSLEKCLEKSVDKIQHY